VGWFTANIFAVAYSGAHNSTEEEPMSFITQAELVEIVPDLRAMASVEASVEVRAALTRLADRYAAMAVDPDAITGWIET
jgi:hypothetical protein